MIMFYSMVALSLVIATTVLLIELAPNSFMTLDCLGTVYMQHAMLIHRPYKWPDL